MNASRQSGHRYIAAILTIAFAFAVSALAARAHETEPNAHNETIVRQAFEKWRAGGNVFRELLAADVKWTIHGSGPVAGTYTSLDDFIEKAAVPLSSRLATPIIPDVHDIWAVGDTVIVRFAASATTVSGQLYANEFVWIFRMTEGVVTEAEAFLDLAAYQKVIANNEPRRE